MLWLFICDLIQSYIWREYFKNLIIERETIVPRNLNQEELLSVSSFLVSKARVETQWVTILSFSCKRKQTIREKWHLHQLESLSSLYKQYWIAEWSMISVAVYKLLEIPFGVGGGVWGMFWESTLWNCSQMLLVINQVRELLRDGLSERHISGAAPEIHALTFLLGFWWEQ